MRHRLDVLSHKEHVFTFFPKGKSTHHLIKEDAFLSDNPEFLPVHVIYS